METGTFYVWIGGSCDYGHEERASAGAYILQQDGHTVDTFLTSDFHTTEFRMILTVMLHAMDTLPENSDIVFLTNVEYIRNFDKEPTGSSANADLIHNCITLKTRHHSVAVKILPYHKYPELPQTHDMAHDEMERLRNMIQI